MQTKDYYVTVYIVKKHFESADHQLHIHQTDLMVKTDFQKKIMETINKTYHVKHSGQRYTLYTSKNEDLQHILLSEQPQPIFDDISAIDENAIDDVCLLVKLSLSIGQVMTLKNKAHSYLNSPISMEQVKAWTFDNVITNRCPGLGA